MNRNHMRGFSMLEGLTILLIISILLGVAMPSFEESVGRSNARADVRNLISALNMARTHAIAKRTITTFCPSSNGRSCGGDWAGETIIFRDTNNNRVLDDDEQLLEVRPKISTAASIAWKASARRNGYIRFSPSGAAREFGTFTYCAVGENRSLDGMLVINRMGRGHLAKDNDGDGIVEKHDGSNPQC